MSTHQALNCTQFIAFMIALHGVRSVLMRDGRAYCFSYLKPDIGLARWVIREQGRGGGWAEGWEGTDANRFLLRWVYLILILLFSRRERCAYGVVIEKDT